MQVKVILSTWLIKKKPRYLLFRIRSTTSSHINGGILCLLGMIAGIAGIAVGVLFLGLVGGFVVGYLVLKKRQEF